MQAAVAFSQASSLARPFRRLARPYHAGGADAGVVVRGGVSLPRLRRACCSASLSVGAGGGYGSEHAPVFPRQKTWDPYKLLGVDRDATEEEINSARNFLLQQYAGYEESEEAIEGAYDKIMMKSYSHRKKSKINLKSKLKKQVEESPSWVKTLLGYFEVPAMDVVSRRLAFFGFLAGWSIGTSAGTGPTFQLALSLVSCIYFLNDKMKNLVRASATGLGVFVSGWIVGSLLVPVIPTFIVPPTWCPELLTSLVAYAFLFLGCTFLK
ncbi:protein CHAPERONE-LIKE PROTEIN OF POR1, chloroplastic-like [Lolium rigidum]|uniref:protein CHAPERONE-LIKE PROTEIN OF POR1, chloroplastic-like n=1 Tax=Lolium rigidum TaxID=89674 RepID=UPI001F5C9806|nr:protein CHAPERONE-LIKE PROTEIN OF POR1, chloroplastic-like [Lolium rigidum]